MGKMLGGDEEKDPDAAKKEEERQEALRQEEEERKAKYAKMEAEREAMRQGIRDKVGTGREDSWAPDGAPPPHPPGLGLLLPPPVSGSTEQTFGWSLRSSGRGSDGRGQDRSPRLLHRPASVRAHQGGHQVSPALSSGPGSHPHEWGLPGSLDQMVVSARESLLPCPSWSVPSNAPPQSSKERPHPERVGAGCPQAAGPQAGPGWGESWQGSAPEQPCGVLIPAEVHNRAMGKQACRLRSGLGVGFELAVTAFLGIVWATFPSGWGSENIVPAQKGKPRPRAGGGKGC